MYLEIADGDPHVVSKPAVIVVDYHDCVRGNTSIGIITRKTHIRFRPSLRVRPSLGLNTDNNTVGDWPRV
jgi:hypothetical protein